MICTRNCGDVVLGVNCPDCDHHPLLHPVGTSMRPPYRRLTGECVMCRMEAMLSQMQELSRRNGAYRG